jgi:cell wall-associated NlpC family hydrolase
MSYSRKSRLRRGALISALALGAITGSVAGSFPAFADAGPASSQSREHGLGLDPLGDQAAYALVQLDTYGMASQQYVAERDSLAAAIGLRIWLDPTMLQHAWARADEAHQRALLTGMTQLGVRYRTNASNPGVGFDCSGLTTYAWSGAGLGLTRQSAAQIKAAGPRTLETAQAGDLVYYPGHVSIYLGVGRGILHSPYPGRRVEVKIQGGNKKLRFGDPTSL